MRSRRGSFGFCLLDTAYFRTACSGDAVQTLELGRLVSCLRSPSAHRQHSDQNSLGLKGDIGARETFLEDEAKFKSRFSTWELRSKKQKNRQVVSIGS